MKAYTFNKYLNFFKLFVLGRKQVSFTSHGKKVYLNNINNYTIYEKSVKEALTQRTKLYNDIDCFIDVGAHIGTKCIGLRLVNKKCEYYGFEPVGRNFELLQKNVGGDSKNHLFNHAIGANEYATEIFIDERHLNVSSLDSNHSYLAEVTNVRTEVVEVKSLDIAMEKDLANFSSIFLKIDVESLEEQVIKGASQVLKAAKYLEIEISQDSSKHISSCLNMLNREYNIIDFEIFQSGSEIPTPVNFVFRLY